MDPESTANKGNVERWLLELENLQWESVRRQVELSLEEYPTMERTAWTLNWPAQAVIATSAIFWTSDVNKTIETGGYAALNEYVLELNKGLTAIVMLVRGQLSKLQRKTLSALVVMDVHSRDTCVSMARRAAAEGMLSVGRDLSSAIAAGPYSVTSPRCAMGKKKSSSGGKGGGKSFACAACAAPLVPWEGGNATVCCQKSYCEACTSSQRAQDKCSNCGTALPRCEADSRALLEKSANRGNSEAQAMLADRLMASGATRAAVLLYRASAAQGHARAIYNLGACYEQGKGVGGVDECNAFIYYQKAAAMGYRKAQFNLGNAYRTGKGLEDRDLGKAIDQYLLAAKQGSAEAQYNYALMQFNGMGCAVDKRRAIDYCKLAADQGYAPAVRKLPIWQMSPDRQRAAREAPPSSGGLRVAAAGAAVAALLWFWFA